MTALIVIFALYLTMIVGVYWKFRIKGVSGLSLLIAPFVPFFILWSCVMSAMDSEQKKIIIFFKIFRHLKVGIIYLPVLVGYFGELLAERQSKIEYNFSGFNSLFSLIKPLEVDAYSLVESIVSKATVV